MLSKELRNSTKIKVGQAVLELLVQNNISAVLIYNLKTTWPTNISMPFMSSLNNLLQDAYLIFHKVVDYFEIEHKTC